ncbi:hypothetical protein ACTWQB_13590 [Piscibacillus sp. B03]|uniref:hypothetical protein n=1 Tax=Piscibacillus sp. B03 TaxID=3457430 RepID=UPI003FCE0126
MIEHNLSLDQYVEYIKEGIFRPKSAHELLYEAVQYAIKNNQVPKDVDSRLIQKINALYLLPASQGYDIQKRMLILVGPPGSGKSSIVRFMKKAIENFSKTEEGAVYKIGGCPMQEDPLLALPDEERQKLPVYISGKLSPYNLYRLKHEWQDWRDIPVERFLISEIDRQGIGTFFPADSFTQDTSDLIGSIDYANITKYGSPADPRAYRYDGEFQAANRGLLELQEVFKSDQKMLYPFLSLAEEKQYKISRQSLISADEVVIGHTNEAELQQMIKNEQSPLLNRMVFIKVGYTLSIKQEVSIYKQKLQKKDLKRLGFRALETLAAALILTRMNKPKDGFTRLEMLEEFNSEGQQKESMSGLDPRYAFQVLSVICAKNLKHIYANDLLDELKRVMEHDYRIAQEHKKLYLYHIQLATKYYDYEWLKLIRTIIEKTETNELNDFMHSYEDEQQLIHRALGIDDFNQLELQSTIKDLSINMTQITFNDLPNEGKYFVIDWYIASKQERLEQWVSQSLVPTIQTFGYTVNNHLKKHLLRVLENHIASYF